MPEQQAGQTLVTAVAKELSRCRQRGLDDLEDRSHNQEPVRTPELDRLAHAYCRAMGKAAAGRIAELRTLLEDGLVAYAQQGNESDSRMIAALLYDGSQAVPKKRPGELLATVQHALGYDDKDQQFTELRRKVFQHFARFLLAFVEQVGHSAARQYAAEGVTPATPPPVAAPITPSRPRRSRLVWTSVGVVALVVATSVITAVLVSQHRPDNRPATHATSSTSPALATPHYQPGTTFTEMAGEFGAPTFADPQTVSGADPKVQPYQQVQVSCKLLAPSIPSVSPDGYWYRIASPPWDNRAYAAANAFMNGDRVGQLTPPHNTDFAVPDCPL